MDINFVSDLRRILMYSGITFTGVVYVYGMIRGDKDGKFDFLTDMPMCLFYGLWYSPKKWTLWVLLSFLLAGLTLSFL